MNDPLIPITALEGVMKKAFLDNDVPIGLFWDALLKANLYVPLKEDVEANLKREAVQSDDLMGDYPMVLGLDSKNNLVIWLFTSPLVMQDYIEKKFPTLEMAAPTLFRKVLELDHEVVLIGPQGLTLSLHPDLVKTLADGKAPEASEQLVQHVPKDAQVLVGTPDKDTRDLEQRFSELFRATPSVLEACFVQVADDTGSRLLLGLRLDHESRDNLKAVTHLIAKAAEGILPTGQSMDITLMSGSLNEAFKKWGKSFYVK